MERGKEEEVLVAITAHGCLQMHVAHAGKKRAPRKTGQKGWISVWLHRRMWLWRDHCLSCTTAASQTRTGSRRVWLLSQRTPRSSMFLPGQRFTVQMATSG